MKKCRTCHQIKSRDAFSSTGWHVRKDGTRTRLVKADCHNEKAVRRYHQMFVDMGIVMQCVILCKNCHAELHAGVWSINDFIVA